MSVSQPTHLRIPSVAIGEECLDNGLQVFVVEDRTVPVVAVNLWYNVGSRHEPKGKTGFAHLFEHVMFQGSTNVASNEHMALMNAVGGDLNATTSFDRTNYFEAVPTGALELALWLEADRMGGLLDALSQENLDNQRDVVRNERRERNDNQPYGTAFEQLFEMTFPEGHPYHHMPIGSMEDLAAASLHDVTQFFRSYYHPGNAVLTLVGDLDADRGFTLAAKYFGGIPAHPAAPAAPDGSIGPMRSAVTRDVTEQVPADAVFSLYRAPADGSDEADALDVAARILAGSESSRLTTRLVRDEELAQQVYVGLERMIGGVGATMVQALARSDVDVNRLGARVSEEIERFVTEGPSDDELEIAKATLVSEYLQSVETCAGLADEVSHQATLFGDATRINTLVDRINAVSASDVVGAARTWLAADNRSVLTYHQTGSAQ